MLPANATPVNLWLQFRELQKAHALLWQQPCKTFSFRAVIVQASGKLPADAPGSLKSWLDAQQTASQLPTRCNPSLRASAGCVPDMTFV